MHKTQFSLSKTIHFIGCFLYMRSIEVRQKEFILEFFFCNEISGDQPRQYLATVRRPL